METEYRVGPNPNGGAGAPHRRERIWILSYANVLNDDSRGSGAGEVFQREQAIISGCEGQGQHPLGSMADTNLRGCLHGQTEERTAEGRVHAQREPQPSGADVTYAGDFDAQGVERSGIDQKRRSFASERPSRSCGYGGGWRPVEPGLGGTFNGLAEGLHAPWSDGWEDGTHRVTTETKNRANRLKAIGNGQVPQAAVLAWKTLMDKSK